MMKIQKDSFRQKFQLKRMNIFFLIIPKILFSLCPSISYTLVGYGGRPTKVYDVTDIIKSSPT